MMMTNRNKVAALVVAAITAAGVTAFKVDELLDGDDEYVLMQTPVAADNAEELREMAPPSTVAAPSTTQPAPPAAPADSTAQVPPAAASPPPPGPAATPPAAPAPAPLAPPSPPAAPAPPPAPAPDPGAGQVDAQQAMRIGAAAAGGSAIDVWPGSEYGRAVFYVDVRTGAGLVEVYVEAATGKVLAIESGD